MNNTQKGRFVSGLIAGALAGAAIGLVAAPKPGKETRQLAKARAGEYVGALREKFASKRSAEADEPIAAN